MAKRQKSQPAMSTLQATEFVRKVTDIAPFIPDIHLERLVDVLSAELRRRDGYRDDENDVPF